jgi:hypothetical protein
LPTLLAADVEMGAPRIFRGQDADIRGEMDEAIAALRGQIDIGDATIGEMSRIDGEMRRAVDLGITPDVTKIPPAGGRLSSFDLKGDNSRRVRPSVRSGNAAPGPKGESNRLGWAGDRDLSARLQWLTPVATVRGPRNFASRRR